METKIDLASVQAVPAMPVVREDSTSREELSRLQSQLERLAAVTELVARIESTGSAREACQALVDQVQPFLSAEQVLVGLCPEGSPECRLTAVSGVSNFHPRGELAQAAQAALQESIARGEPLCWPAPDPSCNGGLLSHRQFARHAGVEALASAPLRDAGGKLRGAWIVTGSAGKVLTEDANRFLRAAETPLASALRLVARAEKGPLLRAFDEIRRLLHEKRGRVLLAATVMLVMLFCIPLHYYPKCDCTVEPVTRRYVAAPFAGPLKQALVEPGDVVDEGQLLARMDGREVRMELSGTRADLHRAAKQRDGHLATHESGEAEVARFEVDRLQVRTELLEHRERNLDIRSPIAGVVVSGDLEDAEGMPLEVGQTLFEIAPLDRMVVELNIAEEDFAYVRPGLPVTIRLDAFPLRRFKATIQRVHPRAELRDDDNVFVAEVQLERPGGAFRPGMRGTAHVKAGRYPLAWNLFRRPITAVVAWLGW